MFAYFILRNPFNTNNVAVDHSAHVGQIPDTIRDLFWSPALGKSSDLQEIQYRLLIICEFLRNPKELALQSCFP